jgi:hypothetical protein
VQIELRGTIERTFRDGMQYDSPAKGRTLVMGMAPQGEGRYHGKLWLPREDRIYLERIAPDGEKCACRVASRVARCALDSTGSK